MENKGAGRGLGFLRTTTFRQTLLSAALFALSSFLILAFVYFASVGDSQRRSDALINDELAAARAQFDRGGLEAVERFVNQRTVGGDYLYILLHPNGRRVSGNLTGLPDVRGDDEGRIEFAYRRPPAVGQAESDKDERVARGRIIPLSSGYRLFVGLDVQEERQLVGRLIYTMLAASALALALGVAAGILVSRRFARRLDAINSIARGVRSGDLTGRAPRNHTGDELDELSENFNAMLDRVEQLMHRMRNTGDSIAHDLRTPLTRMRNRLEEALREEGDLEAREETLARAVSDIDEVLGVFSSILSLSRLESGESRRSIAPMDPATVLVDLAEMYEPVAEDTGLEFDSDIQGGITVNADRGLLFQATANLLDNAMKYTPEGGAIMLRLRRCADGRAEISVTDTGPGIPEADRLRVTQRFVRLDNSRSQPGSGLGLSLVQAIAETHQGEFALEEGPGMVDGRGPGLKAAILLPAAVKKAAE